MSGLDYMEENLRDVRERIARAEERSGRVGRTTLVAAVKYTDAEHIAELVRLGVRDLGENRVQQLTEHADALAAMGIRDVRFHFIGTLQRNKVKYLADRAVMIHSLDSLPLAEELERQMEKRGRTMDVLVEINSGREESKSGVEPDRAAEFCRAVADFPHIRLRGFMTMAPKCEKNEDYRKYFRETYKIGLDIWQKTLHNIGEPLFSMGMSGSFEIAIGEGADFVRIGRALFAPPQKDNGTIDISETQRRENT